MVPPIIPPIMYVRYTNEVIENYLRSLPPGVVFAPTDQELINDYLLCKTVHNTPPIFDALPFITILDFTPDQIQEGNDVPRINGNWYFFSLREDQKLKIGKGKNTVRRIIKNKEVVGYWKQQNGKPVCVHGANGELVSIGTKYQLQYKDNHQQGASGWVLHEFVAPDEGNLISLYKLYKSRNSQRKRKREEGSEKISGQVQTSYESSGPVVEASMSNTLVPAATQNMDDVNVMNKDTTMTSSDDWSFTVEDVDKILAELPLEDMDPATTPNYFVGP